MSTPMILDELLVKKIIDLLESKTPKEINKVNDPSTASVIASLAIQRESALS